MSCTHAYSFIIVLDEYIYIYIYICKVVSLVCNVGLLPTALGPSFLNKGVGTGPTGTHYDPACAQTTPRLLGFSYMSMASRTAIKKL